MAGGGSPDVESERPGRQWPLASWRKYDEVGGGLTMARQSCDDIFLGVTTSLCSTVRRAPMVWLCTATVNRAFPSPAAVLDATGMRMAHVVATLALGLPWTVLHFGPATASEPMWRVLLFVAVFKTAGALGYCPASRMFTCPLGGGTCCAWARREKAS